MKSLTITGVIVLLVGLLILFSKKGSGSKQPESITDQEIIPTQFPDTIWETHSLKQKGDSVKVNIHFGFHLHIFSVHNKQYGCNYQGGNRQVIGNGIKYDPYPIDTRYAYISFENDAEDIDCLIVKNGKCEYDDF